MSARDDYPFHAEFEHGPGLLLPEEHSEMIRAMAEIDQLRPLTALGREIEWEIEQHGDPYLMGVRARVEAGDGFTQNKVKESSSSSPPSAVTE